VFLHLPVSVIGISKDSLVVGGRIGDISIKKGGIDV
jgi:hypothetical protein